MCESEEVSTTDVVEISIKGTPEAVASILTGKTVLAIEGQLRAEKETESCARELSELRNKLWEKEDALTAAERSLTHARGDLEHRARQLASRDETINGQSNLIDKLTDELNALKGAAADVVMTDDALAQMAAAYEKVFQDVVKGITFPADKEAPKNLRDLMRFFVFPIFQAGTTPSGWQPGQAVSLNRTAGCSNKINMIKMLRALTGAGLKDAKDFIEGYGGGNL